MDGLKLLQQAREVGLRVSRRGETLIVRGPRACAPLAKELIANKADVIDALEQHVPQSWPTLTEPLVAELFKVRTVEDLLDAGSSRVEPGSCYACKGTSWWRLRKTGHWVCVRCLPPVTPRSDIERWEGGEK